MKKTIFQSRHFVLLNFVLVFIYLLPFIPSHLEAQTGNDYLEKKYNFSHSLYGSISFPLTGGSGITYGVPISDHLVLSSAFYK